MKKKELKHGFVIERSEGQLYLMQRLKQADGWAGSVAARVSGRWVKTSPQYRVLCGDVKWIADEKAEAILKSLEKEKEDESLDKCPRCGRRTEALMQFNKKQVCECCLEELEAGSE